jgi:hypothetical protein
MLQREAPAGLPAPACPGLHMAAPSVLLPLQLRLQQGSTVLPATATVRCCMPCSSSVLAFGCIAVNTQLHLPH